MVTTSQGGTVDVTIVSDQSSVPPPSNVRVTVRMGHGNEMVAGFSRTFEGVSQEAPRMAVSLAAQSRVLVDGLSDDWAVKAITLDNEDVTDKPIELRNGQNAALRVILTNRTSDVVGAIAAPTFGGSDAAIAGATVVVFAEDERKWEYPTRFVRIARASGRGTFQIPGLPPNEQYRAIAVDYLEDGEESDPDFLKRMRDRATRFSLTEGEQRSLDLRLIQR
jgi:hypothetical protein